jgi:hypothetical protein
MQAKLAVSATKGRTIGLVGVFLCECDCTPAMPVPDYQSLMIHVLSASADGEVRIGDAVEKLADRLGLTSEERAELLPSGKQTMFANRVH